MDDLDKDLEAQRRVCTDLKMKLDAASFILQGMERAAKLRPSRHLADRIRPVAAVDVGPKRGRQTGSLTKKWRLALADLARPGNPSRTMDEVLEVVVKRSKVTMASARERVRLYVATSVIEELDGRYRVSQETIDRYKLKVGKEKTSAVEAEVSQLNGAGASA